MRTSSYTNEVTFARSHATARQGRSRTPNPIGLIEFAITKVLFTKYLCACIVLLCWRAVAKFIFTKFSFCAIHEIFVPRKFELYGTLSRVLCGVSIYYGIEV